MNRSLPDYRVNNRTLNHIERRELIAQPLPTVRRIPGKSWAGVLIDRTTHRAQVEARMVLSASEEEEFQNLCLKGRDYQ